MAAFVSYVTVAFGVLSGLLYTPWMIRTIGTEDFAIYSLTVSVVSLVAIDLGLGAATSRFLALHIARRDKDGERRLLTTIVKVFVILSFALAVALSLVFLFAPRLYPALTGDQLSALRTALLAYGMYSVLIFPFGPLDGVLLANEKLIQLKGLALLQKALTVALMVVALLLGYGLYGVVAANILGGAVVTAFKLRAALRATDIRPQWRRSIRLDLGAVLGFSVWTTVISISQRLIINIQPSVLAGIAGSQQVALFSLATTIEGYVYAVASGINGLLLPRVTRLMVAGDDATKQLQRMLEGVGRIQLYLLGTIAAGFVLLGSEFMRLWVGPGLAASYWVAVLLILPAVVLGTLNVAETALVASGKIRNVAFASFIAAVLSLPLSLLATSFWGALGSAFAVFIGTVVGRVAYVSYVYSAQLGLRMGRFFVSVHLKVVPWLTVATALAALAGELVPGQGWVALILRGIIFLAIVGIVLWALVLTPNERKYFRIGGRG